MVSGTSNIREQKEEFILRVIEN